MPAWVKSPQLSDEPGRGTKWECVLEWMRQKFCRGGDEGVPGCSQHRSCVSHPAIALLDRKGASGLRFSGTLRKIVILGHLALVLAGFWE